MKKASFTRLVAVLLLYCVMFGPVAAVISLFSPWIPKNVHGCFEIFFFPHFAVAYYSPLYWRYFTLWLGLGGLKTWSGNHSNYREYIHHTYHWWNP
jgi:hypothetical protein